MRVENLPVGFRHSSAATWVCWAQSWGEAQSPFWTLLRGRAGLGKTFFVKWWAQEQKAQFWHCPLNHWPKKRRWDLPHQFHKPTVILLEHPSQAPQALINSVGLWMKQIQTQAPCWIFVEERVSHPYPWQWGCYLTLTLTPFNERLADWWDLWQTGLNARDHSSWQWDLTAWQFLEQKAVSGTYEDVQIVLERLSWNIVPDKVLTATLLESLWPTNLEENHQSQADFNWEGFSLPLNWPQTLQSLEKHLFEKALGQAQGNQTLAATWLGLNRSTFIEKCRRLGISLTQFTTERNSKKKDPEPNLDP